MEKKDFFRKLCLVLLVVITRAQFADSINIISRHDWKAKDGRDPYEVLTINPPPFVVIHHAASPSCYKMDDCKKLVKSFQNYHMVDNNWDDIGYHFLVGEDSQIYEGRGWGVKGAHAPLVNARSIGICIIGNFTKKLPNTEALTAVKDLIDWGVGNNKIATDYKLIGHRQVRATECPGQALYNEIKKWDKWSSTV